MFVLYQLYSFSPGADEQNENKMKPKISKIGRKDKGRRKKSKRSGVVTKESSIFKTRFKVLSFKVNWKSQSKLSGNRLQKMKEMGQMLSKRIVQINML